MQKFPGQISKEKALQKIMHYCAYRERNHHEVKQKLYGFGIRKTVVEEIIAQLIEEGRLNESRYAIQFAGGKFRINKWGRIKIAHELKQKQVSAYNLRKALDAIDEEIYRKVLNKLADDKWKSLKAEQYINRQSKTIHYLLQKGYENALVQTAVKLARETKT